MSLPGDSVYILPSSGHSVTPPHFLSTQAWSRWFTVHSLFEQEQRLSQSDQAPADAVRSGLRYGMWQEIIP